MELTQKRTLEEYFRYVMSLHEALLTRLLPLDLIFTFEKRAEFEAWYDRMVGRLEDIGSDEMFVFLKRSVPAFKEPKPGEKAYDEAAIRLTMTRLANTIVWRHLDYRCRLRFEECKKADELLLDTLCIVFGDAHPKKIVHDLFNPTSSDPDTILKDIWKNVRRLRCLDETSPTTKMWVNILFLSFMERSCPAVYEEVYKEVFG